MVAVVDMLPPMPRKPLPDTAKKVGIAARIDPALKLGIEDLARADRRTFSFMVEEAVRFFLEHHRKGHRTKR